MIQPVSAFVEKPKASTAADLFSSGAVWNTMVLLARAKDLLQLCVRHAPEVTAVFVRSLTLAPEARAGFLAACYRLLPAVDFSRDVLAREPGLLAYTWPALMGWSDLGTPARLQQWTRRAANRVQPANAQAVVA
jgi:mannose-1-phosphate guanylyltransferase